MQVRVLSGEPNLKDIVMDLDKIKSSVTISDAGCWEWQKSCNSAGYGQLTEDKKYWLAHRYTYDWLMM